MRRGQCLPGIPRAANSNATNSHVVFCRQTSSRPLIATGADHVTRQLDHPGGAMPLVITSRLVSDVVIVDVNGRLCLPDVGLREHVNELLEEGHRAFVLNLAKVPYVDSFGLGQLITICTSVQ